MPEKRTIIIQDPGTTSLYKVELTETSRGSVGAKNRSIELLTAVLEEQEPSGLSLADMATIASDAADKMKVDGYI